MNCRTDSSSYDLTKYFMKRDVTVTTPTYFTHKPDMYLSCKHAFQVVMKDAGTIAKKRPVGSVSAHHARSIHSTTSTNPESGLQ